MCRPKIGILLPALFEQSLSLTKLDQLLLQAVIREREHGLRSLGLIMVHSRGVVEAVVVAICVISRLERRYIWVWRAHEADCMIKGKMISLIMLAVMLVGVAAETGLQLVDSSFEHLHMLLQCDDGLIPKSWRTAKRVRGRR